MDPLMAGNTERFKIMKLGVLPTFSIQGMMDLQDPISLTAASAFEFIPF